LGSKLEYPVKIRNQTTNQTTNNMKKLTLIALVAVTGLSASVYGQGYINLDNNANTGTSVSDTSNGSFFLNGVLINEDFNVQFLGGSTSGNLANLATFLLSLPTSNPLSAIGGNSLGAGTFTDPTGNSYPITGTVPNGSAFIQVFAWTGDYTSYAAAEAANLTGVFAGSSTIFSQSSLGGGEYSPGDLTSMPAVNLVQVPVVPTPEPSSLALAGLGGLGMLMAMRRKKA
jgi:hypothetical protein